jgi:hypothetical protein
VGAVLLTFAVLGAFFLVRYARNGYRFPIGWDAAYYVWRVNAVTFDGLAGIGAIRAGAPLLMAILMRATGQNALTMVAIVPAVLTALVGLSAAAMVRAATGMRAVWFPVVAFLTWTAFGNIGMVGGHLDNLLNASLVMGAFAAAVGYAWSRRGVIAVGLFFMAAALAEWPFYAFAMGVFLAGLALFCVWALVRRGNEGLGEAVRVAGPLFGAAAVSGVFTGLSFLSIHEAGGVGLRLRGHMKVVLKRRFVERLHQTVRYWAFPLAAMGAVLVGRRKVASVRLPARTLFLSLTAAWLLMTILAGAAQLAGIPVAGGRLLSFLFAIPVLTGAFVWLAATMAKRRLGRAGLGAAVAIVVVAVGAFGVVAYKGGSGLRPWMEPAAVREIAEAGVYLERYAPGRDVVFVMATPGRRDNDTLGRWWYVVRAILPPDEVPRAHRFVGTPLDYVGAIQSGGTDLPADIRAVEARSPVAIVVQRYNPLGFDEAAADLPGRVVAAGVLALGGPVPTRAVTVTTAPQARTTADGLVWVGALIVVILLVAGSGWAVALLPDDVTVRVALAPVLGAAIVSLVALLWGLAGLSFGKIGALGPLVLCSVGGWVAAVLRGRTKPPPPVGRPTGGPSLSEASAD